jgi:hypothetical protein
MDTFYRYYYDTFIYLRFLSEAILAGHSGAVRGSKGASAGGQRQNQKGDPKSQRPSSRKREKQNQVRSIPTKPEAREFCFAA